jgi:hypothetical protein
MQGKKGRRWIKVNKGWEEGWEGFAAINRLKIEGGKFSSSHSGTVVVVIVVIAVDS